MNEISKYSNVVKLSIRNKLEYRFNTIMALLSRLIFFITLYALWSTIYSLKEKAIIGGYNFSEMISYTFVAVIVSSLVDTNVGREAYKQVKNGEISTYILKPLNFILYHLSWSFGVFIFELAIASAALFIFINILPEIALILTPLRIVSFTISLIAANIIYSQFYITVGMFAFWIKEARFLIQFVKKLVKFLGGGYIPITLFPQALQMVINLLPFSATIYFPSTILVNKNLENIDIVKTIVFQYSWVLILFLINKYLWKKGIKNYESVGI